MPFQLEPPHSTLAGILAHWRKRQGDHTIAVQAATLTLAGQLHAVLVAQPAEIGVGVALIEPGPRTDEGLLIVSVTPAWEQFLKLLAADPNAFMQLDPRQMEELIAGGYERDGWTVTLMPRSGDGAKTSSQFVMMLAPYSGSGKAIRARFPRERGRSSRNVGSARS
jgi:hypothetical protein